MIQVVKKTSFFNLIFVLIYDMIELISFKCLFIIKTISVDRKKNDHRYFKLSYLFANAKHVRLNFILLLVYLKNAHTFKLIAHQITYMY